MTNFSRKRGFAGAPIKEKRKIVPEPAKIPPKAKPREYILVTRKYHSYYTEDKQRFSSRAARDQAKADTEKKVRGRVASMFGWYKDYKIEPKFEEYEE